MNFPPHKLKRLFLGSVLMVASVFAGTDSLVMLNGDLIQGRFEVLKGTSLLFNPLWAHQPVEIPAAFVGQLKLSAQVPTTPLPDVRLELMNGDRLQGRLIEVTENVLVMETGWKQALTFQRDFIHRLFFLPEADEILFDGAVDPEAWALETLGNDPGSSGLQGNVLSLRGLASGGVTLPQLPEKMVAEFAVRNLSNVNVFTLEFLARGEPGRAQEGMALMFHGDWLTARVNHPRGRNQQLFRGTLDQMMQGGEWVNFRILSDLKNNEYQFWINGEYFHTFQYETEENMVGRKDLGIRFQSRNPNAVLEVSDMLVWESKTPFPRVHLDDPAVPDKEYLTLYNGDVLRAKVMGIESDVVRVRLPEGQEVSLRRDRVDSITLQPNMHIQPKRWDRDVRLRLSGRADRITLRLKSFDAEGVTGMSDLFLEPVKIPVEFLNHLEFNIHQRIRLDHQLERDDPLGRSKPPNTCEWVRAT
ncbi:MAG: hypothetical protein JJU29_14725 [Verrucomicrobia bacterium]|nr:hypothetical protein [Verrucomicrobiota bacterium]MCH8513230.1 hypothetical protein [Kiritimatiellia bacterium]